MRKTNYYSPAAALLMCAAVITGIAQESAIRQVRVARTNVNLRAKPMLIVEVAGQVQAGAILNVKSSREDWIEVEVPHEIGVWVSRSYVKDDKITGNNVNIRAGPGMNFSVIGQLNEGESVEIMESYGDWLKIAPKPQCSLWVHRSLVEPVEVTPDAPATVPAAERQPAATEQDKSAETQPETSQQQTAIVAPAALPEKHEAVLPTPQSPWTAGFQEQPVALPPPDATVRSSQAELPIIPLPGQGKSVTYEGVLRRIGYIFHRPSDFRLVREDESGRGATLCYVIGNTAQLETLLGRKMRITGSEYWVQGKRHPVVVLERIVLSSTP